MSWSKTPADSSFVLRMSPLYPLVHPHVFDASYLDTLVQDEGLLLGAIIAIAARYSDVLTKGRAHRIHADVSQWVRAEISRLMDGDLTLRTVSTVEALLLLSEWPMLTDFSRRRKAAAEPDSEEARLLQPSQQYDAYCWTSIGKCDDRAMADARLRGQTVSRARPQGGSL